jgi:hypothetical protein
MRLRRTFGDGSWKPMLIHLALLSSEVIALASRTPFEWHMCPSQGNNCQFSTRMYGKTQGTTTKSQTLNSTLTCSFYELPKQILDTPNTRVERWFVRAR